MKASVIIPTWNRADVLDACLASLALQTLAAEAFEVIVVDNGSTDATCEVVARHASKLRLRLEFEPDPGLHNGRHRGLRAALSDVLVFADDDIEATPTWLDAIVRAFEDPTVALVGGNNLPLFECAPPAWLTRWWEAGSARGRTLPYLSILDFGDARFDVDPHLVWGCNFSIRRKALLDAGGFHPDALPADRLRWRGDGETHVSESIRRAGLRALFDGKASVGHRVAAARMSRDYFARRAYAQGISDSYTDIRHLGRAPTRGARAARFARTALRRLRAFAGPAHDDVSVEMRAIRLAALDKYCEGYDFHQREVTSDPELLAWVLKDNYL